MQATQANITNPCYKADNVVTKASLYVYGASRKNGDRTPALDLYLLPNAELSEHTSSSLRPPTAL
jgi:hypothetical protein